VVVLVLIVDVVLTGLASRLHAELKMFEGTVAKGLGVDSVEVACRFSTPWLCVHGA